MLAPKTMGYFMAFFAVIIWAGNFVVARAVAFSIPPMHMNFWRWVIAFACLIPFAIQPVRKDWPHIKKHLPYLALMGLIGVTGLNTFFYQAGSTTSSINMVLFVPSAPILIMLLSRIFCGEAITLQRLAGFCIILLGLGILISRGDWNNLRTFQFHLGDVWSIAGVMCFGFYSFLSRYRPLTISATSFLASTFSFGLLFCLPVFLWEIATYEPMTWSKNVIIAILYSGIGCSTIAYMAWTKAIDAIGPVTAGIIYYLIPVFTALEGIVILNEQIHAVHIIGGACMLSGIALATFVRKPQKDW